MTEIGHKEIENKLKAKYVGKFIWDKEILKYDRKQWKNTKYAP